MFCSNALNRILQACGYNSSVKFHTLRKTFATNILKNNAGMERVIDALRYSFVVKRMNLWMEEGKNLTAMMPYLSKYLGHESVENTYYYYYQIRSLYGGFLSLGFEAYLRNRIISRA